MFLLFVEGGGDSNNLRVCARLNCKEEKVAISKSSALCNITFIKVACIIMDYPGDSIDCQFELSLQYLEPGGEEKNIHVCRLKGKK